MGNVAGGRKAYLLNITTAGCAIIAKCNDIVMLDEPLNDSKGISINVNLNEYLISGKNMLVVNFKPIEPNKALKSNNVFKAKIKLLDPLPGVDGEIYKFDSSTLTPSSFEHKPSYEISHVWMAELPFSNSLGNLELLSSYPTDRIVQFYRDLSNMIKNNEIESVLDCFRLRYSEYATAYYNNDLINDKMRSLRTVLLNKKNVIENVDFNTCNVKYEFYNRLAYLVDSHGQTAIQLYDEENDIITYIDFKLGKLKSNDGLSIIR